MRLGLLLLSAALAGAVEVPCALRGPGSVLLVPGAEPLRVTITKRDLNIYEGADALRLLLLDPSRRAAAAAELPDDGEAGRGPSTGVQRAELAAPGVVPGIYRLSVSGSGDTAWGFTSNAARCVVDDLWLFNTAEASAQLWFQPPDAAFELAVAVLHPPGHQVMTLRDGSGAEVRRFDLTQPVGQDLDLFGPRRGGFTAGARTTIAAQPGRSQGLWGLDIPKLDARVQVAGVRHWSPTREAWFDAAASRWLLLPYGETRYLAPGQSAVVRYHVRHGGPAAARYRLTVNAPPGLTVDLATPELELRAGERREVSLTATVAAGQTLTRPLEAALSVTRVDDPSVVASATLTVRGGEAPWRQPLTLPIVLQRYQHENALFGYAPDYVPNEVYFDLQNRPWMRNRETHVYPTTALQTQVAGQWQERSFVAALQAALPGFRGTYMGGGFLGAKVAFDDRGGLYTLVSAMTTTGRRNVLLFSPDEGRTWTALPFEGDGFDLEQFTGHNPPSGPPPIIAVKRTAPHPAEWADIHDLYLYMPRRSGDQVTLGEPILVSQRCLGLCQHSGGPATTATRDGRTHIVWGEVTDEAVAGVPTYAATYDHATRKLSPPVLLAYAPPINDVHNAPGICLDSRGLLHAITGSHGEPFLYRRSLRPHDTGAWTPAEPVLTKGYVDDQSGPEGRGRQTYLSLVCGPDDRLHIAYRQWRRGVDPYHPGSYYAALSYQNKPLDGPWGEARPVVVPPCDGYSIYYHKLTIDRRGGLWLAHGYLAQDATYQDDFWERNNHLALLCSHDGGTVWKLAEDRDFPGR